MRKLFIVSVLLALSFQAFCKGPKPPPSFIAPAFFGPYAYPVPTLDEAMTSDKLYFWVAGDAAIGRVGGKGNEDYTYAPSFRLTVPLWTDRVNLNCWGEMAEWWFSNPRTQAIRRVGADRPLKESGSGQIWLGLDVLVCREKEKSPSFVVSANLLTAAGDGYVYARHYDNPGYFFTGSVGKQFEFADKSSLRLSATVGFVCWQINPGWQNDAILGGVKLSYTHRMFTLSTEYGCYAGWEDVGDVPMSVKARLDFPIGKFSPFIHYTHGFKDYPFDIVSCGLKVSFDVLRFATKN